MASDDPVERVPAAQAVGEDLASGGQPALGAARDLALAEALDRDQLDLARPALGACAVEVLMLGDWRATAGEVGSGPSIDI